MAEEKKNNTRSDSDSIWDMVVTVCFVLTLIGMALSYYFHSPMSMLMSFTLFGIFGGLVLVQRMSNIDNSVPYFDTVRFLDTYSTGDEAYKISIPFLFSMVIRSDGVITDSEKETVSSFLKKFFPKSCHEMYDIFERVLSYRAIDYKKYCGDVLSLIEKDPAYDSDFRKELVRALYSSAYSDERLVYTELGTLRSIAKSLKLNIDDINEIEQVWDVEKVLQEDRNEVDRDLRLRALAALGVSEDADDETIKRAYRDLALECHPDMVKGLPEEERIKKRNQFEAIQAAYDMIFRNQKARR